MFDCSYIGSISAAPCGLIPEQRLVIEPSSYGTRLELKEKKKKTRVNVSWGYIRDNLVSRVFHLPTPGGAKEDLLSQPPTPFPPSHTHTHTLGWGDKRPWLRARKCGWSVFRTLMLSCSPLHHCNTHSEKPRGEEPIKYVRTLAYIQGTELF